MLFNTVSVLLNRIMYVFGALRCKCNNCECSCCCSALIMQNRLPIRLERMETNRMKKLDTTKMMNLSLLVRNLKVVGRKGLHNYYT